MILYFAGAEAFGKLLADCGVKHILISYYYMREKGEEALKNLFEYFNNDVSIMVDSGAYTFLNKVYLGKSEAVNWDEYLEKYIAFLLGNKKYIKIAVNLDIDSCVGKEKVEKWNSEYFEKLIKPCMDVCYVWHESLEGGKGLIEWERYCKDFGYVGTSGIIGEFAPLAGMFSYAEKYKTKIHGFGLTSYEEMLKWPFYSVDSTTWISGGRYGKIHIPNERGMATFHWKDKIIWRYKDEIGKVGVDVEKLMQGNWRELNKWNIFAWRNFMGKLNERKEGEKGLVVSGKAKVLEVPKGKKSPVLLCDACYLKGKCQKFETGAVCAFAKQFQGLETRSFKDILQIKRELLNVAIDRLYRNLAFEVADGGMADKNVTQLIQQVNELSNTLAEMFNERASFSIEARGEGILSKLFGEKKEKKEKEGEVIEEANQS